MKKARLIAVYGENGSGKTLVSYGLAHQLARLGGRCILVTTDTLAPQLNVLVPSREHGDGDCLGILMQKPNYSFKKLLEYVVIHPDEDNLGIMGYAPGVTPETYRFTLDDAEIFFDCLRRIGADDFDLSDPVDFVVVDCQSNPLADALSEYAILHADWCLRLVTPNMKGIMYEESIGSLLSPERYQFSTHIRAASRVFPESPLTEVEKVIGPCQFIFPYSKEAELRFGDGHLLTGFQKKPGYLLSRSLENCAKFFAGKEVLHNDFDKR